MSLTCPLRLNHAPICWRVHSPFSHSFTVNRKTNGIQFWPPGSLFPPHSVKWGKQASKQTLSARCIRVCKSMWSQIMQHICPSWLDHSHCRISWWILIINMLKCLYLIVECKFSGGSYTRDIGSHIRLLFPLNICLEPTTCQSLLSVLAL